MSSNSFSCVYNYSSVFALSLYMSVSNPTFYSLKLLYTIIIIITTYLNLIESLFDISLELDVLASERVHLLSYALDLLLAQFHSGSTSLGLLDNQADLRVNAANFRLQDHPLTVIFLTKNVYVLLQSLFFCSNQCHCLSLLDF